MSNNIDNSHKNLSVRLKGKDGVASEYAIDPNNPVQLEMIKEVATKLKQESNIVPTNAEGKNLKELFSDLNIDPTNPDQLKKFTEIVSFMQEAMPKGAKGVGVNPLIDITSILTDLDIIKERTGGITAPLLQEDQFYIERRKISGKPEPRVTDYSTINENISNSIDTNLLTPIKEDILNIKTSVTEVANAVTDITDEVTKITNDYVITEDLNTATNFTAMNPTLDTPAPEVLDKVVTDIENEVKSLTGRVADLESSGGGGISHNPKFMTIDLDLDDSGINYTLDLSLYKEYTKFQINLVLHVKKTSTLYINGISELIYGLENLLIIGVGTFRNDGHDLLNIVLDATGYDIPTSIIVPSFKGYTYSVDIKNVLLWIDFIEGKQKNAYYITIPIVNKTNVTTDTIQISIEDVKNSIFIFRHDGVFKIFPKNSEWVSDVAIGIVSSEQGIKTITLEYILTTEEFIAPTTHYFQDSTCYILRDGVNFTDAGSYYGEKIPAISGMKSFETISQIMSSSIYLSRIPTYWELYLARASGIFLRT